MVLDIVSELKKGVSLTFSQTIPTGELILSLLVAVIAAIMIIIVYKKTYIGVSYTKSFSLSIILLAMVTSLVIKTVNSNLSLSLGMVGALSIVRFRTAVKDPIDTIFMFWAITVGIMTGAGLYLATILATLLIGLSYFIYFSYQSKKGHKALLVIKTYTVNADEVFEIMANSKAVLKTESYKDTIAEITYELADRSEAKEILKYKDSEGLISLNVIDLA